MPTNYSAIDWEKAAATGGVRGKLAEQAMRSLAGAGDTRYITTATNVPAATGGGGAYGGVPGATTTPNPASQWAALYPYLTNDTQAATDVIRSQLSGVLSPEVQRTVTDAANARNVAGG